MKKALVPSISGSVPLALVPINRLGHTPRHSFMDSYRENHPRFALPPSSS